MPTSTKIEKALKLKALADRGDRGERRAAIAALEKYMKKHRISPADIDKNTPKTIRFKPKEYPELFLQIAFTVTGQPDITITNGIITLECSEKEEQELQRRYQFYLPHYKSELALFNRAFIEANKLFPATVKPSKKAAAAAPPPPKEDTQAGDNNQPLDIVVKEARILKMAKTIQCKLYVKTLAITNKK